MFDTLPPVMDLSDDEMRAIREDLFLAEDPNAVFSRLFLWQIRCLRDGRILDTHAVADAIRAVESGQASRIAKGESAFTRRPLKGFWHTHFFCARFMAKNLALEWGVAPGKGKNLERMLSEEFARKTSGTFTPELINRISARLVDEAYTKRAGDGRLTGEWIVYAKQAGRRIYLTLATHLEGDERIYSRMRRWCAPEFPLLFQGTSD